MQKKHMKWAALMAAAGLLVAGCGVTPDDTYEDAEELQDALVSEGFDCDGYMETTESTWGQETTQVDCDGKLSFAVYPEDYETPDGSTTQDIWEMLSDRTEGSVLLSDSWVILSEDRGQLQSIQDTFGGDLLD